MEEDVAGEGEAVAVDAAAGDADDHVAVLGGGAGEDAVLGDEPHAGAGQVEAEASLAGADDIGDLGDLAAGDADVGLPRALGEAGADLGQQAVVGDVDGDVVEHGDGLGADAEDVVGVHGDAVDADGVVAVHHLGDDGLGADAVGGDGEGVGAGDVEDGGVVAEAEHRAPGARAVGEGGGEGVDEGAEAGARADGGDAGGGVGGGGVLSAGCRVPRVGHEVRVRERGLRTKN